MDRYRFSITISITLESALPNLSLLPSSESDSTGTKESTIYIDASYEPSVERVKKSQDAFKKLYLEKEDYTGILSSDKFIRVRDPNREIQDILQYFFLSVFSNA